jgi:hypothetical protein
MTTAAILEFRPAAPGPVSRAAATDLVRLFGLDRLPARRGLCCHWRCGADGRLMCIWQQDLSLDGRLPRTAAHPAASDRDLHDLG